MQAYIDDSQTHQDVLVLAGFVSDSLKWAAFSTEWEAYLKHARLEEFKMAEFGINSTEIVASFYRIVERHAIATIACAVPIEPLAKVASEFNPHLINQNPYLFGVRAIVQLCADYQAHMGIREPIDFIFDEELGEQSIIHKGWKAYLNSRTKGQLRNTGQMPIFRNSKVIKPIQAADLCAWWYRKMFLEKRSLDSWPYPWNEHKKLALFSFSFDEKDIRESFQDSASRKPYITVGFTLNGRPA